MSETSVPFFSICVPQFNRTSFLIEALRTLASQTFTDFEVCISDDCSTDGRSDELIAFMKDAGIRHVFRKQPSNVRYDKNLRTSISLASGQYCFLLGNDDALASPSVLEVLHGVIERHSFPAVLICNYENPSSGVKFHRMTSQGDLGRGPDIAASHFRNYSFISGLVFETARAHEHATDKWDGSEQYQMYLGSRMIAEGGTLVGVTQTIIHEDIQIPGESVDSVTKRSRLSPCPIVERPLPLNEHGRLVVDAIIPYVDPQERNRIIRKVIFQFYAFPYALNVIAYRSIQSWKYAVGIALGMRPANTLRDIQMGRGTRILLQLVFAGVTLGALLVPISLFRFFQPTLYSIAKRAFARTGS